jgi:hypothetical protein
VSRHDKERRLHQRGQLGAIGVMHSLMFELIGLANKDKDMMLTKALCR